MYVCMYACMHAYDVYTCAYTLEMGYNVKQYVSISRIDRMLHIMKRWDLQTRLQVNSPAFAGGHPQLRLLTC